jgi:hypothetical protein
MAFQPLIWRTIQIIFVITELSSSASYKTPGFRSNNLASLPKLQIMLLLIRLQLYRHLCLVIVRFIV